MMEDKLRCYVDELFEETAPTKKAVELKEEMIQNLQDKYRDLIAEGKTPEAAYNIVVAGIGDVSALLRELERDELYDTSEYEEARRKSAMITSIAVMMYILCALPLIVLSILVGTSSSTLIGLVCLFVIAAAATGLLIYNSMTQPRPHCDSDTMVEEFREWQHETHDRRKMRKAISSALWSVIVALYFIISFTTGAWGITWIIFIIGGAVESLIEVFLSMKKK